MQDLIQTVCELMAEENTHQAVRTLALNLLLSIATAANNIHQNTLIEYFMINYETVFDSLLQLLVSERMGYYSFNAVFLLVTLVNYRYTLTPSTTSSTMHLLTLFIRFTESMNLRTPTCDYLAS
jgi:hypothetical protein